MLKYRELCETMVTLLLKKFVNYRVTYAINADVVFGFIYFTRT